MIPRLTNRTPRARAVRSNAGDPRLESLAAEFALLTQRRSRAMQQLKTLDQQRASAADGFAKLQRRIEWLMERINTLSTDPQRASPRDASPRDASPHQQVAARFPPEPVRQAPAAPGRSARPAAPAQQAADALAAIGRRWTASQPVKDHFTPPRRARRP